MYGPGQGQPGRHLAGNPEVPRGALQEAARHAGVAPENAYVHNCFLGGGFGGRVGRREVAQAVEIAKTLGGRPVKLLWTREEDMNNNYFSMSPMARFQAGLGTDGMPVAWFNRVTCDSIFHWRNGRQMVSKRHRPARRWSGLANMPLPASPTSGLSSSCGTNTFPWPSGVLPESTTTASCCESFIDEVAHASGKDPIEFRRSLLSDAPRYVECDSTRWRTKADWGKSLPEGTAQGFSITETFGTVVAEVAQVSVTKRGEVNVEKVVTALDCGNVVNPRIIEHSGGKLPSPSA